MLAVAWLYAALVHGGPALSLADAMPTIGETAHTCSQEREKARQVAARIRYIARLIRAQA